MPRPSALLAVLLAVLAAAAGCTSSDSDSDGVPAAGAQTVLEGFEPPEPLDTLARRAAEALVLQPAALSLDGANGLEQLGARWQEHGWVAVARGRIDRRLANPRKLTPEEAEALRRNYLEVGLRSDVQERLRREGYPLEVARPTPQEAVSSLRLALDAEDSDALIAAWGRAHAWYGHLWIDPDRAALALDGFGIERVAEGWRVRDLLGVTRDFTVRRAGDHASLRQMPADGEMILADHIVADGHAH